MYHIRLQQFPHSTSRFNASEAQLRAIVEPWVRGQAIELGEYQWSPRDARLTILEGPEIPVGQLTMGRGWPTAERVGTDVTEQVLDAARQALFAGWSEGGKAGGQEPAQAPAGGAGGTVPAPLNDAFALGMQMAALLGPDAMRLLDAWRAAAASSPGLAPSETLAQAEQAIRSGEQPHG